jgi:hypothetical protein
MVDKFIRNLSEIVLHGHGNFEEQNKVLDYAIIITDYCIIVIISAYCIIIIIIIMFMKD